MSAIYFHSEHGEARLAGQERHYAGWLCSHLLLVALGDAHEFSRSPSPLRKIVPSDHYIHRIQFGDFEDSFTTWVRSGSGEFAAGHLSVEPWIAGLNTALLMGPDAIRLLARLHGQCEIHAYVRGQNRAWIAGIIDAGRKAGILRARMGWESVADLLRSRDDGPVVTSYSVCDSFPNPGVAEWRPATTDDDEEGDWDAWYELPDEQRWAMAWEKLGADEALELKPDRWSEYHFVNGVTGFMLRAYAVDAAVGEMSAGRNEEPKS